MQSFAKRHTLAGSHVMEYGIGGGLLAELLLLKYNISSYIGVDIANRSLLTTRQRLQKLAISHWKLLHTPQEFHGHGTDIFISLAVIQHFPSKNYTDAFFQNIERSRIPVVLLQVKEAQRAQFLDVDAGSSFDKHKYDSMVTHATRVNTRYILRHLTSYVIAWKSDLMPHSQIVYEFALVV